MKEEPLLSENKVQTTGQVITADILTEDTGKGRTIGTHRGLITQQDTEHRGFNQQWVKTMKVGWKITESNHDDAQEKHTKKARRLIMQLISPKNELLPPFSNYFSLTCMERIKR